MCEQLIFDVVWCDAKGAASGGRVVAQGKKGERSVGGAHTKVASGGKRRQGASEKAPTARRDPPLSQAATPDRLRNQPENKKTQLGA